MCGRYSFSTNQEQLRAQFPDVDIAEQLQKNYNVAPTQEAYVIADEAARSLQAFRWGLIPFWAKDEKIGNKLINARSETLLEKPSFRNAARKRRCWVLADSFYEWKKEGTQKTPYRILLPSGQLLVLAGIWEQWQDQAANTVKSFSIVTCAPNAEMSTLHNRMPVILQGAAQQRWLQASGDEEIKELLMPLPDNSLHMYPVSRQVNSPRNNGPELHEAVA